MPHDTQTGPKVGFFGPMKSIHSAKQAIEILPGGRVRASIQHDTMHGVTSRNGPAGGRLSTLTSVLTSMAEISPAQQFLLIGCGTPSITSMSHGSDGFTTGPEGSHRERDPN